MRELIRTSDLQTQTNLIQKCDVRLMDENSLIFKFYEKFEKIEND